MPEIQSPLPDDVVLVSPACLFDLFSAQKAGYSFAFTAYSALKSCPHQSSQMPSHGVLRLRVVLSRPLPQIVRHGPHKAQQSTIRMGDPHFVLLKTAIQKSMLIVQDDSSVTLSNHFILVQTKLTNFIFSTHRHSP